MMQLTPLLITNCITPTLHSCIIRLGESGEKSD